jgi:hypothetical protein
MASFVSETLIPPKRANLTLSTGHILFSPHYNVLAPFFPGQWKFLTALNRLKEENIESTFISRYYLLLWINRGPYLLSVCLFLSIALLQPA